MTIAVLAPVRARFGQAVSSMSPRDRKLLVGLVIFGVACLLGGVWWFGSKELADVRSRVSDREGTLETVRSLLQTEAGARSEAEKIEDQLRKNAGEDLPSFVEKTASKAGVSASLSGVREKEQSVDGNLEERRYSVELKQLTLQQLTDLLYALETAGYPLKVRSMKTRTVTASGAKALNVTLEISAYRLVEDEKAAPAAEEKP
jgi:type II secretory pathway component PulM